jgi:DNA-binding transcriptional LysR family regulator
MRRIDLNLLVTLDALLEERSVTRAARRLALTQPAVSGALARLRTVFGDPLFVRAQRGILPTPRAEALAEPLKRWLAEAEQLVAPERFDPKRSELALSISTTDYMQRALLLPFLGELRSEAPSLRIAVLPLAIADLGERLAKRDLDLAITTPAFAPQELPSRRLYAERYVAAMGTRHPLARKPRLSLDDFCRFDHLLVSPAGGAFEGPTDAALARLGRRRRVRVSVPSFLLVPELLAGGELLAVVPERVLQGHEARIRSRRPPVEVPGFDVVAVWHPRMHDDPAHRWLRTRLARTASALG